MQYRIDNISKLRKIIISKGHKSITSLIMIPDRGYVLTRIYKIEGYLWSISLPRVTCMYSKTTSPRTERRLPSITRLAHQPGILKRCGKPIVNRSSNRRILMRISFSPKTRLHAREIWNQSCGGRVQGKE